MPRKHVLSVETVLLCSLVPGLRLSALVETGIILNRERKQCVPSAE